MAIDINNLITISGNINDGVKAALKDLNKNFTVTMLDTDDLEPSQDNFYKPRNIDKMRDSIESFGIQQNLIVTRSGEKYEILAGERRYRGNKMLVDEGKNEFRLLPCRILPKISDTLKHIIIILTNSEAREKTQWEVTEEVARLKILYENYRKENPNFKGRVREATAEDLGISPAQIGRHEKIKKNLIEPLQEEYKKENINFTTAQATASLPPEQQEKALEKYKEQGSLSTTDIKEIKDDTEEPENQITNECGIYLPEHITETKLNIPPKYGNITIKIAFDERDNKYRHGYDYHNKDSGSGYMPSDNCKPFNTEKDAFNDMLAKLRIDTEIEKALIAGGYIQVEDKPKVQVREFQIVDTETTIQEPIEPEEPDLSETEIIIIALNKNREAVIREIEKIPVNNEESGRVTVNGVRLARWTMIKQIFDNELEELSGNNMFKEEKHE